MRALYFSFAILWLSQLVSAAGEIDLVPLPRHLWDHTMRIGRRDETTQAANVTLVDYEEMQWTSPPHDPKPKNVSLVFWTGQDRLILDMAKFGWGLKAVNCTENMMVQFRHNISFQAAKKSWDWVNFNGMRSFVMIADHIKCGREWSPDPWLVSSVRFDQSDFTIHMEAEKKTWKYIIHSYTLDFGEVEQARRKRQSFLDFDLDKAFTLDLASTWPSKIIHKNWTHATFDVSCVDCGTSGQLVFSGHIEGSAFSGIDKFMISATPRGLQAALNLEIAFEGLYKFGKDAKEEFELLTIPLPSGWRIPGVLTFGPNAKVLAGYELESVAGSATVTTGIAAKIPDDSLAKVDLFGKKKLDVHGWIPTFEIQPLQLQAELTATGSLWTKVAVAVSLEVLVPDTESDENGVNVDVNLQFPKVTVTASGGYDSNGFCNADPFGVSLDVDLGAELELEGWTEIDGKRNVLFEVDLYENDQLYQFPVLCLGLGESNDGTCSVIIEEEDQEWWDNEIDSPITALARLRRQTVRRRSAIAKRAPKRGYYMTCDKSSRQYKIEMKDYYGPEHLAGLYNAGTSEAPILLPGVDPCGDDKSSDCTQDHWKIEDTKDNSLVDGKYWDAEHVYEGDWVKSFLNHLHDKYFSEQTDGCNALGKIFKIGDSTGYMDKLLSQLGTTTTYDKTMTVFTKKENQLKHRFFSSTTQIDRIAESTSNTQVKLCRIGRIINTCLYMMQTKTQENLKNTLTGYTAGGTAYLGVDGVFAAMDADTTIWGTYTKPTDFTTWAGEHKSWFIDMYQLGIGKAQAQLQDYAYQLVHWDDFDDMFDEETRRQLEAISIGDMDKWCKNTLSWS
ncbi:hypothetical protein P152DRAFT_515569 [Eremomyces bilateralis CBS 781.70]|uniref:Uncharacterized protein n=1 Tax=Eremomyces bilateralis CBS 781.70 TaxID=1392243 RepID=A0A6G1FYB2_9PEZI|nr:uncharacterized protein P152DRAFT_515569 [Eremomyces bilateralis CBS 781.70]KAF1810764.1 hypothetical protein P152DRAFT_515569 [Eremomyces bilateralis CBS 781.70]